jgi:WD40 repeat protein
VEVVGRHDRLVRAACAGHGGHEVGTEGDAFFVAFTRAGDAVAAAVRAQRALAAERWPEGVDVRVRMGLHSGEPVVGTANYVGLAVHRAARICAIGHGGQILLSTATRELLEDDPRLEISFRDLGEWRLKDFDRPEHLFQIVVDGLAAEFPPPVSVAARSAPADSLELPPELEVGTPLAGRELELADMREQWRCAHGGTGRLMLITGGPGMGKTRLASELAGEVHRDRGAVLYASGVGARPTAVDVVTGVRGTRRPTLLVLDDVDRAGGELRAALGELVGELAALPVLVVATAEEAGLAPELRAEATIVLRPLDADGVRAVVRLYVGEREEASVPVERLAAATEGVPLRVHRAAADWARTLVVRRLADTAGRLAAERPVLRAAEDELAGNIVELQAARERTRPEAGAAESVVVCPFKGLASFDIEDAGVFFGRERLVAEMVARLTGAPLMGIVGPSGSGKSSVLRAGLLAALAAGVLPGSERWELAMLRPGDHPMRALEQAAAAVGPRGRLVLAVDQFEEVFTSCRDATERAEFVDALVASARDPRGRALVLVAVRADFYGRCAAYPELSRVLGANHVLVGSMQRDELRRAVELPARSVGLRIESELVEALITDVAGEPGALPLLSTSLLELWQRRDGRRLTLSAYQHAGGVHGAVARLAESSYERLEPGRQDVARRILLRLAGEGEGEAVVRRRVPVTELEGERSQDVAEVLSVLADDRLVTIGEGEAEVAHEALLREWPRLRGWLQEDAHARRLHLHLGAAAREWDAGGRDPSELYRGARLAAALEWRSAHDAELNRTERAFLDSSRAAAGRSQRRLRIVLAGVAALLAVAILGGLVAMHQRSAARSEARAAEAQRLGEQALTEPDLDRSLLLARQGVALDDSPATRSNLLVALLRAPAAIGVIRGTGNPLVALDLSPGGGTLAVGDRRGTVLFIDAAGRRRIGPPFQAQAEVAPTVRFSPDGRRLAVAAGYGLELVDAHTHRRVRRLYADPDALAGEFQHVVFSPDSRVVAADFASSDSRSRGRRYIQRWDATTGVRLGRARSLSGSSGALVGFAGGETRLVTSGPAVGGTTIRDATTLHPIRHWRGGGTPAALSPDGRSLAFGDRDGSVRVADLRTGDVRVVTGRHDGPVTALRFTPDSRSVVSAATDDRLILRDVTRRSRAETLENPTGQVSELAVSRDGRTAYTAGVSGSLIAWDLSGTRQFGRPFRVPARRNPASVGQVAPGVVASPDEHTFAVPERTGYVDLFDTRTLARTGRVRLTTPGDYVAEVAIGADGRTMAATTLSGRLAISDLRSHEPLGPPVRVFKGPVAMAAVRGRHAFPLALSGDGRWLATSGSPGSVAIWDVRRRTAVNLFAVDGVVADVSVSPNGKTLATTVNRDERSGELDIVSLPLLKPIANVRVPLGEWGRFSRDGRLLLYGDEAGRTWLFDTRTWRLRGQPLVGHTGTVLTVNLSADSRMLATTSVDGTTRLWDAGSGRAIGTALPGAPDHPVSATFVDGGRDLVTVYDNGRGYLWDVRPGSWARRACQIAGRTLTRAEWRSALPERDYAPACAHR